MYWYERSVYRHILHSYDEGFHYTAEHNEGIYLYCHVDFEGRQHKDIKTTLLTELIEQVEHMLGEIQEYTQCMKQLEEILQTWNAKMLFCNSELKGAHDNIRMKGVLQIVVGNEYVAALIGEVGIMILRDEHVEYMIHTHPGSGTKDIFTKLIDGELVSCDTIIALGKDISSYFDAKNVEKLIHMSKQSGKPFDEALLENMRLYLPNDSVGFVTTTVVSASSLFGRTV